MPDIGEAVSLEVLESYLFTRHAFGLESCIELLIRPSGFGYDGDECFRYGY